jgi:glycosyltransferase involved in cell wall biosynthesis
MRIIYWNNSCLQPEIEAVSKEVFQLAHHFPDSFLFGINPHYLFLASRKQRYVGFHPGFDPLLRLLIPLLERQCDLSHVYGELMPWTFYKTLYRKPLVWTIASEKGGLKIDFAERCRKVLVQTDTFQSNLLALGLDQDKVEVVYPGVDLRPFRPCTEARCVLGRPRILFATAPRSAEEMAGRGVNLLLEAAQKSPDIQYRLLYRAWRNGHTSLAATRQKIEAAGLRNVTLTNGIVRDMPTVYHAHHFTVIPYTRADGGKECPTSLIEGLACGLPVLISSVSPFAYFVEAHACGVVFDPTPDDLITAVEIGLRQYAALSARAVDVAQRYFSEDVLLQKMERIYQEAIS